MTVGLTTGKCSEDILFEIIQAVGLVSTISSGELVKGQTFTPKLFTAGKVSDVSFQQNDLADVRNGSFTAVDDALVRCREVADFRPVVGAKGDAGGVFLLGATTKGGGRLREGEDRKDLSDNLHDENVCSSSEKRNYECVVGR